MRVEPDQEYDDEEPAEEDEAEPPSAPAEPLDDAAYYDAESNYSNLLDEVDMTGTTNPDVYPASSRAIQAYRVVRDEAVVGLCALSTTPADPEVQDSRLEPRGRTQEQPERDDPTAFPFVALVDINGVKAYTLFDSGSTTDAVSPEFAAVASLKTFKLSESVRLQLGVKGSRSTIAAGSRVDLRFPGITFPDRFVDIINLDLYDLILGAPFLRKAKASMDWSNRSLTLNGHTVTLLSSHEDAHCANSPRTARRPSPRAPVPKLPTRPNLPRSSPTAANASRVSPG